MKYTSSLLVFVITMWAALMVAPSWVEASSGFYVSGEVGANFASGLDTTGTSNDRASWCDEYINPQYQAYERCTGPDRSVGGRWENEFDRATGILAGAAAGYSFAGQNPSSPLGGLRVELEYFYRQSKYNQVADIPLGVGTQGQKLRDEIVQATDRIGSVISHNLFGNLFYDFVNTSLLTPYIGIGGGVGFTDMEYGSVWARNDDASKISTGEGLPNVDEIRRNLANTVSVGQATLNDVLWGFQVLFGVDYAVTQAVSLGLKGRWVRFGSFTDDFIWNPLRSHAPNLRLDGSEPVSGKLKTSDLEFFGVSVNLKYHF